MKLDIKGIAILALIAGVLAYFWLAPGGGVTAAPTVSMQSITGGKIDLAALKGKPYLVVFWSTTCPDCVAEIPHLVELDKKMADTGFNIIGVAMPYDELPALEAMRAEKGINYPVVLDQTGELGKAFGGIKVTPTSFLVGPDGKIIRQQLGDFDYVQLEQQIRALLKG